MFISSVEIPVSDLERAKHWYEQVLGYSCTWSDQHHAMLACQDNASSPKIFLVETSDLARIAFRSTHMGVTHSVIDFETDDLEAVHTHLTKYIPDLAPIPQPANESGQAHINELKSQRY